VASRKTAKAITRLKRTITYRLIIPVLRAKHPADYTARGVLVGLFIALTPTVGIQMPIVFGLWLVVRALARRWDFNLIVALAWTWATNVFTMAPTYFIFLATGRLLMGEPASLADYRGFSNAVAASDTGVGDWWQALWLRTADLFDAWGLAMFVGSIPWAVTAAWLGYVWSLRLIERARTRRRRRARPVNGLAFKSDGV
jgi:uncharacterized protein (DUF2062 family)